MICDLSVSMDFFSRRKPEWEWPEEVADLRSQTNEFWAPRYAALPLYEEMDMQTHVGCTPDEVISRLAFLGFDAIKYAGNRESFFADRQAGIFNAFGFAKLQPDMIMHFGASHGHGELTDADVKGVISEQTWGHHLRRRWLSRNTSVPAVLHVTPPWLELTPDNAPTVDGVVTVPLDSLSAFVGDVLYGQQGIPQGSIHVRRIFVARTAHVTPPHFENDFSRFVHGVAKISRRTTRLGVVLRRDVVTSTTAERLHDTTPPSTHKDSSNE